MSKILDLLAKKDVFRTKNMKKLFIFQRPAIYDTYKKELEKKKNLIEITVWGYIRGHKNWGLIPWTFHGKVDPGFYDLIQSPKIEVVEIIGKEKVE